MDIEAFRSSPNGSIITTLDGNYAFVPNSLPTELDTLGLDDSLVILLAQAEHALGRLAGIGDLLPDPALLVIPYTRLEAVASTRIEGTQTSLTEVFYYQAAPPKPPFTSDYLEVENYLRALNYGLAQLDELPLSLRLIREMHRRLMANVRGGTPDKTPGEFRTRQNWIGGAGATIETARYVPPPPPEMLRCLDAWEKFLHVRGKLPLLIQCAMMHYQFEAIHPFFDGNGRMGRLLITLFLCEREVLKQPLLYLSAYFERHRGDYYDQLLAVSRDGDWAGWLRFFLQGVVEQSQLAVESASRILEYHREMRALLASERGSRAATSLLDAIFTSPYLTITQAADALGVQFNTAQSAIDQMVTLGILQEVSGQKRNRVYAATGLLQLISDNEPIYTPKDRGGAG